MSTIDASAESVIPGTLEPSLAKFPFSDQFWEQVLIFPDVVRTGLDGVDHYKKAKALLSKLTSQNLQFIARKLQISVSEDAHATDVATRLLESGYGESLTRLASFARARGRLSAAEELFDEHLATSERRTILGDYAAVKGRSSFASFTKLFSLALLGSEWLLKAFVYGEWRSRSTRAAFTASGPLSAKVCEGIAHNGEEIADDFASALKYDTRLTLHIEVHPSLNLFLFQRERKPQVQADFRATKSVNYLIGWILFGIDTSREVGRVVFKSGGDDVAGIVNDAIAKQAAVTLRPEGIEPFTDYKFDAVANNLLGEYPKNSPIDLVALTLSRCNRRSVSPMSVGPPLYGGSIREDLKFLRSTSAVAISSIADIECLTVRYLSRDVRIKAELNPFGSVFLRADDSRFPPAKLEEFFDAFEATFGLPLNCQIDPRGNATGFAPVFSSLLRLSSPDGVAHFQRDAFNALLNDGYLKVTEKTEWKCRQCNVTIDGSPNSLNCPECHQPLQQKLVKEVLQDIDVIYKSVQKFFRGHTKWRLRKTITNSKSKKQIASTEKQAEKKAKKASKARTERFSLEAKGTADIPYEVLISTESNPHLVKRCLLTHRPVLVVHTHDFSNHPHSDPAGTVHLHLADLLAAVRDPVEIKRLADDLETQLHYGQLRQEEIVERAGALAAATIGNKAAEYTEQDYEKDVFAILRSIFPFTDKWGGQNKPDGFVRMSYFEKGDLRKLVKVNWSYDAKLTSKDEGYHLSKDEKRKAYEYVLALEDDPELQGLGNQLDAHVFISNLIPEEGIRGVAEHFQLEHNARTLTGRAHLALLREEFLVELHRASHQQRSDFIKRWPHIGRVFKKYLTSGGLQGYTILDADSAKAMVNELMKNPPVEQPADADTIRQRIA